MNPGVQTLDFVLGGTSCWKQYLMMSIQEVKTRDVYLYDQMMDKGV